ncbi:MAG TPA: hypothetical protein VFR55_03925 [Dehalococcoidia bacterium]|nr:hypothetical protein [Dehalococcoidia bacterium]
MGRPVSCDSCQVLVINGVICHEHGYPDAWKDYTRACRWCGSEFQPQSRYQEFCDEACAASYRS